MSDEEQDAVNAEEQASEALEMQPEAAKETTPATAAKATPTPTPKATPEKPTGPSWTDRLKLKWAALKDFYRECIRVLKVTKKPDKQEFTTVVKISGLGILAIGLIGFLIHLAKELLL